MASIPIGRKFRDPDTYSHSERGYYLLPFKFASIGKDKEVLVSLAGDFVIAPKGTSGALAKREIRKGDPIYRDLLANFIIADEPRSAAIDLLATRYRTKKSFLDSFTSLHIFVVTLRCNHTCHYCQVSRVTENKIDFDISLIDLTAGVELMFQSPATHLTMEFQGGEPMLAFDRIKFAIELAVEKNVTAQKEITYVICTNATIFSEQILAFCKKHNILISTSLDGPEYLHNSNRKKHSNESYATVVDGINYFREGLGKDRVSALMTASSLSLDHPLEIVDCYLQNGFSSIFLRPISPFGFALRSPKKNHYETERFLAFYETALNYIIDLNLRGTFFSEDFALIVLKKMLTPFPTGYVDLQSPAGLINSVVVFNYDGFVYASDEARMLAENKDYTFRLGHVSQPYRSLFFGATAKEISHHWSNEALAGCSDCAFQIYCGADPIYNYATQKDLSGYRPTSTYCKKNMSIFKLLLNLIDKRGPEVLPIFRNWLRNTN
jgi:His-Xaa-Ser system radical SAM maturase HxsB